MKKKITLEKETIELLSETEIFTDEVFEAYLEIKTVAARMRIKALLKARAKELKCLADFNKCINAAEKELDYGKANDIGLAFSNTGHVACTIDNFVKILDNDARFTGIKYNSFKKVIEIENEYGDTREWSDADDSEAKRQIEIDYGINNEKRYEDAMKIIMRQRAYNPLKEYVDSLEWDGQPRVAEFLANWLRAPRNVYTKEVSRLLFTGGIERLYNPGGKQEDVVVLVSGQGKGKTTVVRWLALADKYYDDMSEIKDVDTMQKIQGIWLCEFSETSALKSTKSQDIIKAFISRQNDRFRIPYAKNFSDNPRQTFFMATANTLHFLSDVTGSRRFYPIVCHCDAEFIYGNEKTIKENIRQCWAEARVKYLSGEFKPYPKPELLTVIRNQQSKAMEEDWMRDAITAYLENPSVEKISVLEIWHGVLKNPDYIKPKRGESNKISMILEAAGWERSDKVEWRTAIQQSARVWRRGNLITQDPLLSEIFKAE